MANAWIRRAVGVSLAAIATTLPFASAQPGLGFSQAEEYIGCYKDDWGRDLAVHKADRHDMTPQLCRALCDGFQYYGVQWGKQCFCGHSYGKYGKVADTACKDPCYGNRAQTCGTWFHSNVYKNRDYKDPVNRNEYIGCFKDDGARDLPVHKGDRGDMTPALCRAWCAGFPYYGVQWGRQCFCGLKYGRVGQVDESVCKDPCLGNPTVTCGTWWHSNIYKNLDYQDQTTKDEYLGCYKDEGARDLNIHKGDRSDMTPQLCKALCIGFPFYGVQWGRQCFCGLKYGRYGKVPDTTCSDRCLGDASQTCGKWWHSQIYKNRHYTAMEKDETQRGCFADGGDRDLPIHMGDFHDTNSPEQCRSLCAGFPYFGVQWHKQCFCGLSFGKHGQVDNSKCWEKCTGNALQTCGSWWHSNIYENSLGGTGGEPFEMQTITWGDVPRMCSYSKQLATPTTVTDLQACKNRCRLQKGCRYINFHINSRQCGLFADCLVVPAENGAITEKVPNAPEPDFPMRNFTLTLNPAACDPAKALNQSAPAGQTADLELCRVRCRNVEACRYITYYATTRACQLFSQCDLVAGKDGSVIQGVEGAPMPVPGETDTDFWKTSDGGVRCDTSVFSNIIATGVSSTAQACANQCGKTAGCQFFAHATTRCTLFRTCAKVEKADDPTSTVYALTKPAANGASPGRKCDDSGLAVQPRVALPFELCATQCRAAPTCYYITYNYATGGCVWYRTCNLVDAPEGTIAIQVKEGQAAPDVGTVSLVLRDQKGTPFANVPVRVLDSRGNPAVVPDPTTDATGKLTIKVPPGQYTFVPTYPANRRPSPPGDKIPATIESGDNADIVPQLNVPGLDNGTLTVVLEDQNGTPYKGIAVRVLDRNGRTVVTPNPITDADGKITIRVPPGEYTFVPVFPTARRPSPPGDRFTTTVVAGANPDFVPDIVDPNLTKPEEELEGTITVILVDADGEPLTNTVVEVFDEDGNLLETGTTDEQGRLTITVSSGTRIFKPIYPPTRKPPAGTDGSVTVPIRPGQNSQTTVKLPIAGIRSIPASLSGTVYNDRAPINNRVDAGEGIARVAVNLLRSGVPAAAPTQTDANGVYRFNNLTAGTYTLVFGAIPGFPTVPSTALRVPMDIQAGLLKRHDLRIAGSPSKPAILPGTINARIFLDANDNNKFDSGEKVIPGIPITVSNKDAGISKVATTDANGMVSFPQLPIPHDYTISADLSSRDDVASATAEGLAPLRTSGTKFNVDFAIKTAVPVGDGDEDNYLDFDDFGEDTY